MTVKGLALAALQVAMKGKKNQGILQTFGGVDGDHAQQSGIALQTQDVGIALITSGGDGLMQVANEGLGAVDGGARLLQEFAEMEQVGEATFALGLRQQAGGNAELMDAVVEHGQHALPPPLPGQILKLLQLRLPGRFVLMKGIQGAEGLSQQRQGEGDAQTAGIFGFGHRLQPEKQFAGFLTGIDGILLREKDAA